MRKKMTALLLVLCLALTLLPGAAFAAEKSGTTDDGLRWKVENGVLTISGRGAMQDYGGAQGLTTTPPWAAWADDFDQLVIEQGVTEVGSWAFYKLAIEKVQLPDGLKRVGRNAFAMTNLKTLSIPGSVETMEVYAFSHIYTLESLTIGEGISRLPSEVFSMNTSLYIVEVPLSVRSVGALAFYSCPMLREVYYEGTPELWMKIDFEPEEVLEDGTRVDNRLMRVSVNFHDKTEPDPPPFQLDYTDVVPNAWYYDAVAYCVENQLMNGVSERQFNPNGGLTRGMVVTILWRMCGAPKPEQAAPFTDLTQGWYQDAVNWAQENAIVYGVSKTEFAPDRNISRQDFVTILFRFITNQYAIINEDSIDRFPDHRQVADYAEQPMRWATEEGILTGNKAADGKTYLEPRGTTTRAQAAAIFMRFCETPFDYLT